MADVYESGCPYNQEFYFTAPGYIIAMFQTGQEKKGVRLGGVYLGIASQSDKIWVFALWLFGPSFYEGIGLVDLFHLSSASTTIDKPLVFEKSSTGVPTSRSRTPS